MIFVLFFYNCNSLPEIMAGNFSEKFEQAISRLDFPWSEIRTKLTYCNWRDSFSIWGILSKIIFNRNRTTMRKKLMHFWHNNNSKIQDKVNAKYDSMGLDQDKIQLIVSFDRSNLGSSFFSTFQQSNDSILMSTSPQNSPPSPVINEKGSGIIQTDDYLYSFNSGTQQPNRFILTPQEWLSIKPKIGCNKLLSNWTYIFNQKLSVFFPYCVIKFLYHRINVNSSFRECHYIVAQAVCKFVKCIKFSLWIDEAPQFELNYLTVNFVAEGVLSNEHFDNTTAYSRKYQGNSENY